MNKNVFKLFLTILCIKNGILLSQNIVDSIKIYDFSSKIELRSQYPRVYNFSENSKYLAYEDQENNIVLYNVENKQIENKFQTNYKRAIRTTFSPDGNYLVVGYSEGQIVIIDLNSKTIKSTLSDLKKAVLDIAFSSDSKYFAAGGFDKNVLIYDLNQDKVIKLIKNICSVGAVIRNLSFSNDNKYVVVCVNSENEGIRMIDVNNGNINKIWIDISNPMLMTYLKNDNIAILYSFNDQNDFASYPIYGYNININANIFTISSKYNVNHFTNSKNEQFLITCCPGKLIPMKTWIGFYDLKNKNQLIETMEIRGNYYNSVSISPNNKYLLLLDSSTTLIVVDISNSKINSL